MLGGVGQQFGGAVVGDGLYRGRRALGQVQDELNGQVAACGEGGERGAQAVVQDRRVDAAGRSRILMIKGSEGAAWSLGAGIETPPGTCDALTTAVTYISAGGWKHLPTRAAVDRSRCGEMLPR